MKLKIDVDVIDLLTGKQAMLTSEPATLRRVIIYAGSMPDSPGSGAPEDPVNAAKAFELAARAASVPKGGDLELMLAEAAFLKTRAYKLLFPFLAGPLDQALEAAAAPPDGDTTGAARV